MTDILSNPAQTAAGTPDLTGQVALITGGTRGLGRDLALALAGAGAHIVVLGRKTEDGEAVAASVRALGRKVLFRHADVANQAEVDQAVHAAIDRFGQIDMLVCAAGVGLPRRPVWENEAADFRACFDVNVLGVMLALRAVLPFMVARKSGRIVAIGGTYGHKGVANFALYASSKWALRGLIRSTALEVGRYGITANVIAPGGVDGDRLRQQFQTSAEASGEPVEAVLGRFVAGSALGRLVSSGDVAAALLHLVSEGGRNITGQDIIVDAGTIV